MSHARFWLLSVCGLLVWAPACGGSGESDDSGAGAAGGNPTAGASGAQGGKGGTTQGGKGGAAGLAGASGKGGAGGLAGASGKGGASGVAVCGNSLKEGTEQCDGAEVGSTTCATATGHPGSQGPIGCFPNCTLDLSKCVAASGGQGGAGQGGTGQGGTTNQTACGDSLKEGTEQCDGADLGLVTCASATGDPASTGQVACNANCTLDLGKCTAPASGGSGGTSGQPACGNGVKEGAEPCDGTDLGQATCATLTGDPASTGTLACYPNCTLDATMCTPPSGGGTGGSSGSGGSGAGGDTGAGGSSGGAACVVHMCQSHVYQCGDCIDNDGDGKVDMDDPDCTTPCSNNEAGFNPDIPGAFNAPCKQDCFFDQDSGSGNDDCYWDHSCDPHEVAPSPSPEANKCDYNPKSKVGPGLTCDTAYSSQSDQCHSFCQPLTPNGCDCFGCCDLPAGSGNYVWLGSTDASGAGTCALGKELDPAACHPCEPVKDCLNTCEHCELCLGKTTLPADCLPPAVKCGDAVKNGTEQCDGADLGAQSCAGLTGNPGSTGAITCNTNCTINGSGCTSPTLPPPVCGDQAREGFEQCDGADLGGQTCATLTGNPLATGTLACNANCTFNEGGCSIPSTGGAGGAGGSGAGGSGAAGSGTGGNVCGDGVKNPGEQCDGADVSGATCATFTGNPGATGMLTCNANCTFNGSGCTIPIKPPPACGDGIKNGTEQCDGADLGGQTCASLTGNPGETGTLVCNANCTIDQSGCKLTGAGGSGGSGGSCGGQVCSAGVQACGFACQPACPAGQFCLTGCCAVEIK